ncbi:glycosyltransferase family 25 protein [Psychrobacter sp. Pi2-52]|uniref:glycosyltransferase family 25 protein n=1 Tax=Psychrobacter sp. Pi2-52 TaxID=2774133 RepID=UPI001919AD9F|nr:glycosyltransferase family 25 protein [Psychrobacter sp. Pi2-52]
MQVYVVSLKDSIDRQKSITTQCEKLGIEPIFIDAVNGKDLSKSEVSQYCNQEKAKQLFGRELLLGEVGCALSHKKIYQKIVDENISYAIILEDDVLIGKDFNKVIKPILSLDESCELVLLGHNKGFDKEYEIKSIKSYWDSIKVDKSFILGRVVKGGLGTFGYLISNIGARKLLNYFEEEKITHPIDKVTSDSRIINIYGLFPSVVTVDMRFNSMIESEGLRDNNRQDDVVYQIAKLVKKTPFFNVTRALWFTALKIKPIKRYK